MQNESLNIWNNTQELVLKALNKYPNCRDAAKALGVSLKTLANYRHAMNIRYGATGYHQIKTEKKADVHA